MRFAWLLLLAFTTAPAAAPSTTVDGITVHYAAVPGTQIDATVARELGIVRSPRRIVLNVAVRAGEPGRERSVPADVTVLVRDANGLATAPRMRLHDAGGAAYWLGEARIEDDATLRFEVEVRVAGRTAPIRAVFAREFFVR